MTHSVWEKGKAVIIIWSVFVFLIKFDILKQHFLFEYAFIFHVFFFQNNLKQISYNPVHFHNIYYS